jgi:hypothetical protein
MTPTLTLVKTVDDERLDALAQVKDGIFFPFSITKTVVHLSYLKGSLT